MPNLRRSISFLRAWLILTVTANSCLAQEKVQQAKHQDDQQSAVTIEASNVLFRYSPQLAVLIVRMRGTLVPTAGHDVPSFNDPSSFTMAVEAAEIRLSAEQLTSLMNAQITRSPKAQVKNVVVSVSGNQLKIDGTMKTGLHVAFHAMADVGITGDNRVRISIHQIRVARMSVMGLLNALGLSMDNLVSQKGLTGMSVDGDSFLIDPQTVFPPPQMQARLESATVDRSGIALQFGNGTPRFTSGERGNYIALRGGNIEYGRDEMFNTKLTMTDSTPADSFEFYLAQYWRQMVAGSIKVMPDQALRIRVPDYSKIKGSQ